MVTLQDCFETTDWLMFKEAADVDINEYTNTVSSYIQHCIDEVVPKKVVPSFPNQKPWVDAVVRARLRPNPNTLCYPLPLALSLPPVLLP